MTPDQRRDLERYAASQWESEAAGVRAALDLIDAQAAELAELRAVVDDALSEYAGVERSAREREREECCKAVCALCEEGWPVVREAGASGVRWLHLGPGYPGGCHASAIRDRGPVRPPLRADALRAALDALDAALDFSTPFTPGIGRWDEARAARLNEAIALARAALAGGEGV